jgi:hypothetical protein
MIVTRYSITSNRERERERNEYFKRTFLGRSVEFFFFNIITKLYCIDILFIHDRIEKSILLYNIQDFF